MSTSEDRKQYTDDILELVHLSNIDYLQVIKSLLMNEISNSDYSYNNMRQVGLPLDELGHHLPKYIPLERNVSAAGINEEH